jgi:hypothetical protein
MQTPRHPIPLKGAAAGILDQFRQLGDVLAVALLDESGNPIATAGEGPATAALSNAVARLLHDIPADGSTRAPVQRLFEDTDEFSVARTGSEVSLHVRRVGDDWALAVIWSSPTPLHRLRAFAAETATRLEAVC